MCYARFRQDGLITSGHTANANNALDSWRSAAYSGNKVWRTANRRSPPNPFPAIKLGIFRSLPQAPFFYMEIYAAATPFLLFCTPCRPPTSIHMARPLAPI